jgi:hypothetical protein
MVESVYSAVRADALHRADYVSSLKGELYDYIFIPYIIGCLVIFF